MRAYENLALYIRTLINISITCINGPWQYTITILMVLRNTIMSFAFLKIEIKINLERSIGTYNTEQEIILRYSI